MRNKLHDVCRAFTVHLVHQKFPGRLVHRTWVVTGSGEGSNGVMVALEVGYHTNNRTENWTVTFDFIEEARVTYTIRTADGRKIEAYLYLS